MQFLVLTLGSTILYRFISTMSPDRHQEYIEEIKKFLASDQAQQFSPQSFDRLVYEAVTSVPLPTE